MHVATRLNPAGSARRWPRVAAALACAAALLVAGASAALGDDDADTTPRIGLIAGPEQIVLGVDEESGSFSVHNAGEAPEVITATPGEGAAEWVTLTPATQTVAPGDTATVEFAVDVPAGAAPGDHGIRVDVAATLAEEATAGAIPGRVLSPVSIVVRAPGALVDRVSAALPLPGFIGTVSGEVALTANVRNSGNVFAQWLPPASGAAAESLPSLRLSSRLPGADRLVVAGEALTLLPGQSASQTLLLRGAPLIGSYDYVYTLPGTAERAPVALAGHVIIVNLLAWAGLAGAAVALMALSLLAVRARLGGLSAARGRRAAGPGPMSPGRLAQGFRVARTGRVALVGLLALALTAVAFPPAQVTVTVTVTDDPAATATAAPESPSPTPEQPSPSPEQPSPIPEQPSPTPLEPAGTAPAATPAEPPAQAATPSAAADPAEQPGTGLIVRFKGSAGTAARAAAVATHGGTAREKFPALGIRVVEVPAAEADAVAAAYRSDPAVLSVEQDEVRSASATPSDPGYGDQWNLPRIGWDEARDAVTPDGTATLAVLDTGIAAAHPDLSGLVAGGWSAFGTDPNLDPNGHGTALAGIAAARTDNGLGVAGTAYAGVRLQSVQVLDAQGNGVDSDIIAGILWAADNGAAVILMGFSNPGQSQALQAAVDYAWAKGAVLVAATGNDGSSSATYPAGAAHVMGVAGTDRDDALAASSNSGTATFIAAPGVAIPTLGQDDGVASVTGTSAAAAQVAGAAALLRAADATASNAVVVGRLARTAQAIGTGGGNGLLNLGRAAADSGTEPVDPAGVSAGGGPVVGPYRAAALCAWQGTTSGNWTDATRWSCGTVPTSADTVVITTGTSGLTVTIPAGVAALAHSVTLGDTTVNTRNNIALTPTSSLTVGGALTVNPAKSGKDRGGLTVGGGIVTVGGALSLGGTMDLSGAGSVLNVGGSFTLAGDPGEASVVPGTSSTVNFNGTAAQTVPLGVTGISFNNLTTNNAAGVALGGAATATNVTGNLTVGAGTLTNGGFAVNGVAGRTFAVAAGATFRLEGTSAFPTGFTPSLNVASTVIYEGTTQNVSAQAYGNLTISAAGTKTGITGTTVHGALTIDSGATFAAGTGTYTLHGNATNTATLSAGTSTFRLAGTTTQTVTGFTGTSAFNNLTVENAAGGVSLGGQMQVAGTLTLNAGIVSTGAHVLTLGTSTSAPGALSTGSAASFVNGRLERWVAPATTAVIFPVGSPYGSPAVPAYAPVSLSGLTVTAGGTLTASTTAGLHPAMTGSGIDPNRRIDRYWTLTPTGTVALGYTATLNWNAAEVTPGTNTAALLVERHASGWWPLAVSGSTSTSATATTSTGGFGDLVAGNTLGTALAITSVNGGANPQADTPFDVVVEAQDAAGLPSPVAVNTTVQLTLRTGTPGMLRGSLTGVIPQGASSVTISGVEYVKAETVQLDAADTTPGVLLPGTSTPFAVTAGAPARLLVLLPGQTLAPGTELGRMNPTEDQVVGTAVPARVYATDAYWNPVTSSATVRITSTDPNALLPGDAALVAGFREFTVTFRTAGTPWRVSASDVDGVAPLLLPNDSATVALAAGAPTRFQVLLPGETAAPGTSTGKTGTPLPQIAGDKMTVTVNAVDTYWNPVPSTSADFLVTVSDPRGWAPDYHIPLVDGTRTGYVILNTATATGWTVRITQTAGSTILSPGTSSPVSVVAGPASRLLVLLPGQIFDPESEDGWTGSLDVQSAGKPVQARVYATDAAGNSVDSNTTVAITSSDPNAQLPPATTLVGGYAETTMSFRTVGNWNVTATDALGSLTPHTSLRVAVGPGDLFHFEVSVTDPAGPVQAGNNLYFTVKALDQWDNLVVNYDGTVTFASSDTSAVLPGPCTFLSGTCAATGGIGSFPALLSGPGDQTITATDSDRPAITGWTRVTVVPRSGANVNLALSPTMIVADGTATLTATVAVRAGDTLVDCASLPTVTSGGDVGIGTVTRTGTGLYTANITASKTAGPERITATCGAFPPATATLLENPGPAVRIQVLMPWEERVPGTPSGKRDKTPPQPHTATAGEQVIVQVNVVDANWNVVTTHVGDFWVTLSDPNGWEPDYPLRFVNGSRSGFVVFYTATTSELWTMTATDAAATLNPGTGAGVAVSAGDADRLLVLFPWQEPDPGTDDGRKVLAGSAPTATVGEPVKVTVMATDQWWNLVVASATVAITSSDPSAVLPPNPTLVDGLAVADVTFQTAGMWSATATDTAAGGLTGNTSSTVGVDTSAATQLLVLLPGEEHAPGTPTGKTGSPDPETWTAGVRLPVTVLAVDEYFNVVPSAEQEFTVSVTDPNGWVPELPVHLVAGVRTGTFANFRTATDTGWTITATYVVGSGLPELSAGVSAPVKVQPGPASKLAFTGSPVSTTHGSILTSDGSNPVEVEVQDAYDNLVTGASPAITVAFHPDAPASGGPGALHCSGEGCTLTRTAVAGVALFDGLYIKGIGTAYQLTATAVGLTTADSAFFDILRRPISVTAASATKQYDGLVSAPGTPTLTAGTLATGDTATWVQTYESPLPGRNKTVMPGGYVTDAAVITSANYQITWVADTGSSIEGTILYVPGALHLGTAQRGRTVDSPDQVVSWYSYQTASKDIYAEMTSRLADHTGASLTPALRVWTGGSFASGAPLGTGLRQTIVVLEPPSADYDAGDRIYRIAVPIPADARTGNYGGTLTIGLGAHTTP